MSTRPRFVSAAHSLPLADALQTLNEASQRSFLSVRPPLGCTLAASLGLFTRVRLASGAHFQLPSFPSCPLTYRPLFAVAGMRTIECR